MADLLALFTANILPIFLTAAAGFALGRFAQVDPRALSRTVLYVFSPCLVFTLLTQNQVQGSEFLRIVLYALSNAALMLAFTFLLGKLLRLERKLLVALLLVAVFTNAGNYGLSLVDFAFDDDALAYAGVYFVTSGAMVYSLGILVASMGSAGLREALLGLLRIPTMYALALALLFNQVGWNLPFPLERTIGLLSEATIPCMLLLLGLQLERARWTGQTLAFGLANALRLAVAPALAIGLSLLFGFQGATRQAAIMEASMPTAVITALLATEYDVEPAFVTSVVTTTTLLSPLMLTPLLAFLGGGA